MMFSRQTISSRLRELRGPVSQAEIAKSIGIAQQGWARYEKGKAMPGAEAIHQICDKLGVSADWLLGLSDTKRCRSSAQSVTSNVAQLRQAASQVCDKSDELMGVVEHLKSIL